MSCDDVQIQYGEEIGTMTQLHEEERESESQTCEQQRNECQASCGLRILFLLAPMVVVLVVVVVVVVAVVVLVVMQQPFVPFLLIICCSCKSVGEQRADGFPTGERGEAVGCAAAVIMMMMTVVVFPFFRVVVQ